MGDVRSAILVFRKCRHDHQDRDYPGRYPPLREAQDAHEGRGRKAEPDRRDSEAPPPKPPVIALHGDRQSWLAGRAEGTRPGAVRGRGDVGLVGCILGAGGDAFWIVVAAP